MRVLLVNTRHFRGGGDSTYTFTMADLMRSRGHHVSFFAMQDERNVADPNADLFVDNIDFAALNRRRTPSALIRVLTRAMYSSVARQRFAGLLDRVCPDLVYVQALHGHITPSILPEARGRGIPVVWMLHDYRLVCPNTHLLVDATGEICEQCSGGRFYRAATRRCKKGSLLASSVAAAEAYAHRLMRVRDQVDMFFAPSTFLREKVVAMGGLRPEQIQHLPYCLPAGAAEVSHPVRAGDHFLFAGRVTNIKGVLGLVKAARQAPDLRILIAGPVDESIRADFVSRLPLNASYLGALGGLELSAQISAARAVVVPSIWYENQPFAILEAFAAARPVIASDLGGMRELVGRDERGLLVRPGDVGSLVAAMRRLSADAELAGRLGDAALGYVRSEHGADRHYEWFMECYDMVRARRDAAMPVCASSRS